MATESIPFARQPYDDFTWRLAVEARNDEFSGALEFYASPEELAEFGSRLSTFPDASRADVSFERGRAGCAYYLLLRAFLLDRAGHAALEFAADKRREPPQGRCIALFIECDIGDINRLGRHLVAWIERSEAR